MDHLFIMDFKILERKLCNVLAIIWFNGLFLVGTKNKYTMEYLLTLNHIKCQSCSCAHGAHIAHADTRDAWAGQLVSCHTQHNTSHNTLHNIKQVITEHLTYIMWMEAKVSVLEITVWWVRGPSADYLR